MSITAIDVARKAVELADANPDYIYTVPVILDEYGDDVSSGECVYVHPLPDGTKVGSCLFGQAALAVGIDPVELLQHEGTMIDAVLERLLEAHVSGTPLGVAMFDAQDEQDSSKPWGVAIEPVKKALAEVTA